jgi:site-specific DNA-methyltransferase (adenine-specific)
MLMILEGDVLEVLPTLEASSFDACLCDPPYGLTANKKGGSGVASLNERSPAGRSCVGFAPLQSQ